MLQTKYASAVPKNLGVGVGFSASSGVRSSCIYLKLSNKILQVGEFIICWEVTIDKVVHTVACGAVICASRAQ